MSEPLLSGDRKTPIQLAGGFDALQDVPWAALFKELDDAYPGSKFILTIRDEDGWLNSASKHFGDKYYDMHKWLYGNGKLYGNEDIYMERYKRHYREVENYFDGRKEDLLQMDLKAGDQWEKLCTFLNEPIPKKKFPYENKGKHNYDWKDISRNLIRKVTPDRIRDIRVGILKKLGHHYGKDRFNNSVNREINQSRNE
jgi:hypothetical protein